MPPFFSCSHHDLVSPDGKIVELSRLNEATLSTKVLIEHISPSFLGFSIEQELIFFNIKSTLAQLGIEAITKEFELFPRERRAEVALELFSLSSEGALLLSSLSIGAYIGKLFAADLRRRVRKPFYLSRMFGRTDRRGRPLLCLGAREGSPKWTLEQVEGRTVAFLPLLPGIQVYTPNAKALIPFLGETLKHPELKVRQLLQFIQKEEDKKRVVSKTLLLVKTLPLHIRTVFARVVPTLLPKGVEHTAASILEPDTTASGNIYELYGENPEELTHIPLEFYTLEPYREHVFFSDRDQLKPSLENPDILFKAMETAPKPDHHKCATFVVKGEQLFHLKSQNWIQMEPSYEPFPGFFYPKQQFEKVEQYLQTEPSYPYLEAIEKGIITSQGVLFSRFFPSPTMKRMLLGQQVYTCLKGIYFERPSRAHGDFFSHEDRSMLFDLAKFGVPTFWLDRKKKTVLQYVFKPGKKSGMFVPLSKVDTFLKATILGIYGSNLIEGNFESLLQELLEGLLKMKQGFDHPLFNPQAPLALVTGGGPGIMSVGNRIAKHLGILSCANILDFRSSEGEVINEQDQNIHVEAKMTYRLDRLVERQGEFHLDFPIFLPGGIGTDFEYALEETRLKTGVIPPTPILLIGEPQYWNQKITSRFRCNVALGTIAGSEWVSNCFFCIQKASQGLKVYADFFSGKLSIGPKGPIYPEGFKVEPD